MQEQEQRQDSDETILNFIEYFLGTQKLGHTHTHTHNVAKLR